MINIGDLVKNIHSPEVNFFLYKDLEAVYLIREFTEISIFSTGVRVEVKEHINPDYIGLTFLADISEFCIYKSVSKHSISKTKIKQLYESRRHLYK